MFTSLTSTALSQVHLVRELVAHHESMMATEVPARRNNLRLFYVSSSVTRLYAIYENFVESLVSDYLDVIPEICAFSMLPTPMRKEYRIGLSHLLSRLDNPRYRHLSHENLIAWYHEALSDKSPYRLIADALTRHDENLRLSALSAMFGRVQLADLQGWFSHHDSILRLYPEPVSIFEQLDAELKNFIQVRNDAAHGTLNSLLGKDALIRSCDLVGAVIESLSAFVYRHLVVQRATRGMTRALGEVSEVFERRNSFILPLQQGASLCVGDVIHIVGQWSCIEAVVETLQLDGLDILGLGALIAKTEIGVVASVLPRRNVTVYIDA